MNKIIYTNSSNYTLNNTWPMNHILLLSHSQRTGLPKEGRYLTAEVQGTIRKLTACLRDFMRL